MDAAQQWKIALSLPNLFSIINFPKVDLSTSGDTLSQNLSQEAGKLLCSSLSTATAAKNVNIWSGVTATLPLLGAFVADAYWGRYWTILVASVVYVMELILLTLSASLSSLKPGPCYTWNFCTEATPLQIGVLFASLYLIALGTAGQRPCLQPFGADQFDEENPKDRKHRSSFFNWFFFSECSGILVAFSLLVYIEENIGWGVGFGIPAAVMSLALCVFLYGSRFYTHKQTLGNAAVQNNQNYGKKTRNCSVLKIEELKLVVRLIPVWVSCIMYGVVYAQASTFFTKQGSTMERRIGSHLEIPAAALRCVVMLSIIVLMPMYDRIFVPLVRRKTGIERGITLLQRIGIGLFLSVLSMVVAALTEIKRLKAAKDNGLVDMPHATIPLTIFWLLPQYALYGISDVFAMVGLQEYFYDETPDTMRSLGSAMYSTVFGVGGFVSSLIISLVEEVSSQRKEGNWFADNLNKAHLDYFYWLLAALSAFSFCIYISFASCYTYKQVADNAPCDQEASYQS
eukprot:Gb_10629 [translate_table: standard]